jgi:hypothetical protein
MAQAVISHNEQAVPWLRQLGAGLLLDKLRSNSGPVHLGFVVVEVTVGQFSIPILRSSSVSIIPPMLHTRAFICI